MPKCRGRDGRRGGGDEGQTSPSHSGCLLQGREGQCGCLLCLCICLLPRWPPTAGPSVGGVQESLSAGQEAGFLRPWPSLGLLTLFPLPPFPPIVAARAVLLPAAHPQGTPGEGKGQARHTWHHPTLLLTCVGTWAGKSSALASGSSSIRWGQQDLPDVLGPPGGLSLNAQLGGSLGSVWAAPVLGPSARCRGPWQAV